MTSGYEREGARRLCRPRPGCEQFGWAGEHPAIAVADPAEAQGAGGGFGAVGVDVAGVPGVVEGFGDGACVCVTGGGGGVVVVKPHADGYREEVDGVAAEQEVLGVAQRQVADQAGGDAEAVGADGGGDGVGAGRGDGVVECAGVQAAGGDGVAMEGGDQRQIVGAGGAVAVGECGGVLGELVHVWVGVVGAGGGLVGGGVVRVGRHGPHVRRRPGRVFEGGSNGCAT